MSSVELSRLLIQSGALKFGSFQTKSGRQSPFFLNFGDICDGKSLDRLANLYAASIMAKLKSFPDVIFGPAYKGIPLAVAIAGALSRQSGTPVSFAFDRKEIKDHGEGGQIVGRQIAPHHRVVIVDDVLTSGISIRHSIVSSERDAKSSGSWSGSIVVSCLLTEKQVKHRPNPSAARQVWKLFLWRRSTT